MAKTRFSVRDLFVLLMTVALALGVCLPTCGVQRADAATTPKQTVPYITADPQSAFVGEPLSFVKLTLHIDETLEYPQFAGE